MTTAARTMRLARAMRPARAIRPWATRAWVRPLTHMGPSQTRAWYSVQAHTLTASTLKPALDEFKKTKLVAGKTKMKIGITDRAATKLNSIAESDHNPESALLIKVESGGCHGFQYDIKLTNISDELKENQELLVFKRDGYDAAQLIIDESSLQILQDSKLDYTKELIGSQFKVVDSPYTTSACGCGSSFDFDFDKLAQNSAQ